MRNDERDDAFLEEVHPFVISVRGYYKDSLLEGKNH